MAHYRECPAYDVFAPACPARLLLDRLADKWALLLIDRLSAGERVRFNQLRRDMVGISQKMLAQTLKRLERDGLIEREVHPSVPPAVEYGRAGSDLPIMNSSPLVTRVARVDLIVRQHAL